MSYGCIYIYTYTYLWYVDVYGLLSSWRCSHSGHCFQWSSEPRLCQGRLWRFLCFFSESKWFSGRQSPPAECDLLRPGCVADVEIVAFLSIYIYQYMHIYILFTTSSVCFFSSDSSLSWRIRVFKYPVSSHISLRKYSRTPLWYQDIHPRYAFVWEYSIPIPILNPLVNHRLSSGRCPISRQIRIFRFRFHPVLDPWVSMSIPLCPGMIDKLTDIYSV